MLLRKIGSFLQLGLCLVAKLTLFIELAKNKRGGYFFDSMDFLQWRWLGGVVLQTIIKLLNHSSRRFRR